MQDELDQKTRLIGELKITHRKCDIKLKRRNLDLKLIKQDLAFLRNSFKRSPAKSSSICESKYLELRDKHRATSESLITFRELSKSRKKALNRCGDTRDDLRLKLRSLRNRNFLLQSKLKIMDSEANFQLGINQKS